MAEPRVIVGPDQVRSGYNGSGSDIPKGTIVALDLTVDHQIAVEATATGVYYGVTMEAIADGEWGNVQIRGKALVLASTTVTAGVRVTATTAGTTVAASAGNAVLGIAVTAGTAAALHEVELCGPGGLEMPG